MKKSTPPYPTLPNSPCTKIDREISTLCSRHASHHLGTLEHSGTLKEKIRQVLQGALRQNTMTTPPTSNGACIDSLSAWNSLGVSLTECHHYSHVCQINVRITYNQNFCAKTALQLRYLVISLPCDPKSCDLQWVMFLCQQVLSTVFIQQHPVAQGRRMMSAATFPPKTVVGHGSWPPSEGSLVHLLRNP